MLASGCLIKHVKISTRMVYKKDWCGDGQDKYTDSALLSMDVLLENKNTVPVTGKLRAVVSLENDNAYKTVSEREIVLSPGQMLVKFSMTIPDVQLWNTWETGEQNLYQLKLEYCDAVYQSSVGVKELTYDEKHGKWELNRQRIYLRGIAIQSAPNIEYLKKIGVNTAYVINEELEEKYYEEFDKAGILVWNAFSVEKKDMTPNAMAVRAETAAAYLEMTASHVCQGISSLQIADEVYKAEDAENAYLAMSGVLYESLKSVEPGKTVLYPDKIQARASEAFSGDALENVDFHEVKLPCNITNIGQKIKGKPEFCCWEAVFARIRKYDPISSVIVWSNEVAEKALSPIMVAFEPGYVTKNQNAVLVKAGDSFTSRIWAINDFHRKLEDVKLIWKLSDEDGNTVAGNMFRLNIIPDSAEIPDHVIYPTTDADKGKTYTLRAALEDDSTKLAESLMTIQVH